MFTVPSRNGLAVGRAIWEGLFDASYTKVGDFLVQGEHTYFIAAQEPFLPVVCVRTNRTITITRPSQQSWVGAGDYSGFSHGSTRVLAGACPASVLDASRTSGSPAGLPTDQHIPLWTIMMPAHDGTILSPGDFVCDDLDRRAVVTGAEHSGAGWRLTARTATT